MKVVDLFSGIGAFSLGLERAGMKTIAFCEIDPFCRRVLAKHWPEVPIIEDVTAAAAFPGADVICGGFPCQDVSRDGKRAGLTGARSGLYRELVRAIRLVRPRHAILENVAALLDDGLGVVLGDLASIGYDSEWDCVPAGALGAPHQRDRVWIVAHSSCADDRAHHGAEKERQEPEPGNSLSQVALADPDGRQRRPPDSFGWIRDATRWNTSHAYRERLEERESKPADARQERGASERAVIGDVWQSEWPREPALLGVDDGAADRMDRVRALGNSLIPQIPELIANAILATELPAEMGEKS